MKTKPLLIVFLTVFIDLVGFGMIIPLSPYLAQMFGASSFQVGLLMAAYSGAQFLFSPFWGQLSDRIGRRPVILTSLFGAGVAHLAFGFAGSLWILFAARIFAGMCGGNISAAMASIADLTESKDRSKGMGIIGAAFGLGFVLGPALGGVLAPYGFAVPAIGAAIICLSNFVLAFFIFPETLKNKQAKKVASEGRFQRLKRHFQRSEVASLLIYSFLITFSMANMEASMFLFVEEKFGWGLRTASFGFAYVGIMMAFTQGFLIRRLLPKYGEKNLVKFGALLFGAGMLGIGLSSQVWHLGVAMTMLAIGNGFFNPSVQGLVSLRTSPNQQGEVMGVLQSLSALGRIFGPPIGGFLYGAFLPSSPFLFAAVLSGAVFLLVLRQGVGQPLTSAAAANAPKKLASNIPTDFISVGRFQLENVLRSLPLIRFVDLQTETERAKLVKSPGYDQSAWIFQRALPVNGPQLKTELSMAGVDKSAPLIVLCHTGQESRQLATELENLGFINVYLVMGGALGLLSEDSSH